mgnify:CR=1 FL=1
MNIFREEYTKIWSNRRCSYCNKFLDMKKAWYFVNDRVYCNESERDNALFNLNNNLNVNRKKRKY